VSFVSAEEHPLAQPASINDLQPKMCLQGTVKKIELYGALVDIGLERPGLIHISQMGDRRVDKVSDVLHVGDKVTVWVTSVDPASGRVGLSLTRPPAVEWRNLAEGQTYVGRVVRIERYGLFVDIGAERPGLLHVHEMGHRFAHHPSEMFREGDEVEVRILQIDRRKKRIDLSIEDRTDVPAEEEEEEEPAATLMETAFRRAQEEQRRERRRERGQRKEARRRAEAELDDILSRTLERHGR